MTNDLPNYLPGFEPEKVQTYLQTFFNEVDKDFPDKKIVWAEWNHSKYDRATDYLCKCLGYSSTQDFLNAYGYEVFDTVFINDAPAKTLPVDSNAAKKDKENAFPVYSLAITITTIVTTIFFWLFDGVINDDAMSYAAVGLFLLIVLCVVGFLIAAIRLLILKKKKYSARKTKKKLVIYLVGIIVFACLCGISEVWESPLIKKDGTIVFTNTVSPYKVNDVNDRINQIIKENNSSFAELCDLYSEYDALDESQKGSITNALEFQKLFAQAVTNEITSYKDSNHEMAIQLLETYSDILSENQKTDCMVSIGRWGGLERVEQYIADKLKNPKSYYRYSASVGKPNRFEDGGYACFYTIEYSATNSFGAETKDTTKLYAKYFIDTEHLKIDYAYIGDGGTSGIDQIIATPTP